MANNGEKTTISKGNSLSVKKTIPRTEMGKDEVSTNYYKKKKTELIKMLKMQYKRLEQAVSNGKEHRIERREVKIEEIKSTLNKLAKEIMEKNRGVLPSWWEELAEPKPRSSSQ
jgi:gas vesicle protein